MSRADSTPTAVEHRGDPETIDVPSRYTTQDEIGRGGMGTVFRAHDNTLDRLVALKVMRALDARHIARLLGEAKAMARLSHPNVVHVYDVVTSGDGAVIVMELVRGMTLRQWLEAQLRSVSEILEKFVQAGQGLHAAHQAGLVHLDFKPSNVLIGDDGVAKVTDFGLARTTDFESRASDDLGLGIDRAPEGLEGGVASWGLLMTEHGVVAGTPRYMSPEQHLGHRCGRATDVYAFCVALWEALCGTPPFPQEDREALIAAKDDGPPAWEGRAIAPALEATLRAGLHPDASERPETLDGLLDGLRRAAAPRRSLGRPVLGVAAVVAATAMGAVWLSKPAADPPAAGATPPPLAGFGTDSRFGEDGVVCRVTSVADSGAGSLRECLNAHADSDAPARVEFDVGGTIQLESELRIDAPHLTLDGLSAPAPGVTVASGSARSMGVVLTDNAESNRCAHDVLVQGMRFLGTWDGTQHTVEQRATVELIARDVPDCMRNIVLNRVTVIASKDAAGDMVGSVGNVTVQYSAFLRSHHPMEITNRPGEPLLHENISLHHNVFAYFHERSPQIRGAVRDVDIVQNVFMNWNAYDFGGGYAMRFRCRDGRCPQRINVVGNHWASGSGDPVHALVFGQIPEQDPDDGPIPQQIFMKDNQLPAANANFGIAPAAFARDSTVPLVAPSEIVTKVLPWVGAPYRTDIEQSVLTEVAARVDTDLESKRAVGRQ
ncbi:MAG: protein kinase [Myxococcota bacterium]